MADPRFYDNAGPLTLARVAELAGGRVAKGAEPAKVSDIAALDAAGPGQLSYCDNPKFEGALKRTQAGAVLTTEALAVNAPEHAAVVVCKQPALAFAKLAQALYPHAASFWPQAKPPVNAIAPSARVGEGTLIAPGVVLGENVEIGDDCVIGPGTVIGRGVSIGHGANIGAQVSISHALIGDRCIMHAGCRIGQDGFGFVGTAQGHFKIPQLGRVIIQDDVELGANVMIDRGALGDTIVGEGTKIDNAVHIGHNTRIGRRCIITAQVGISGSVEIGDYTVMGGQVGIADHVKIGAGAYLAAKSGVTRSLEGGKVYGGFPAKPVEQWRREVGVLSRLAKKKTEQG
jgi:UDP-3-O-[3-hydroxymyristoyl] glucosamine N-acyltransferase